MWDSILETISKGLANDDPKLVELILESNIDFKKWVQYYNPNGISSVKEEEKVVVSLLSEDLQDLKMHSAYYAYLTKKATDNKFVAIWAFIHETVNIHFWIAVRTKYSLWQYGNIGLRDGFKVVAVPCNHEMPDMLKRMLGLE